MIRGSVEVDSDQSAGSARWSSQALSFTTYFTCVRKIVDLKENINKATWGAWQVRKVNLVQSVGAGMKSDV